MTDQGLRSGGTTSHRQVTHGWGAPRSIPPGDPAHTIGFPPGAVRIGISGWRYVPWRGVFYPPGLAQRRELEFASRCLSTIEINGSFYSLQRPETYQRWYDETPPGFVFSVKGPRFITHMKKLNDVRTPLANFFASGVLALGRKLGPVLWQLPPNLGFHPDKLAEFFALLPRTTTAAAELATEHDERLDDRALTTSAVDQPLRHALEVRHRTFEDARFVDLLREHQVALVRADTGGRWPELDDVTADFGYLRLHGAEELYASGYDDPALHRFAAHVEALHDGGTPSGGRTLGPPAVARPRDVFVYFDNDIKVRAPRDAAALATLLGVSPPADDERR